MPQQQSVQIGWIPYLNLRPMHHEMMKQDQSLFKMAAAHPSEVSQWLINGKVDLAPASSIAILRSPNLEMALPLGIASDGAVMSVYLGIAGDQPQLSRFIQTRQQSLARCYREAQAHYPDQPQKIAEVLYTEANSTSLWTNGNDFDWSDNNLPLIRLTAASAASVALTKIFTELWFGCKLSQKIFVASEVSNGQPTLNQVELVIGDEALRRRDEFTEILDLGSTWKQITTLPFVFGLWQTTRYPLAPVVRSILQVAADQAEKTMRVTPEVYFPEGRQPLANSGQSIDLAGYWQAIQYRLTDRHLKALLLYYYLYQHVTGATTDRVMSDRLQRWQASWLSKN